MHIKSNTLHEQSIESRSCFEFGSSHDSMLKAIPLLHLFTLRCHSKRSPPQRFHDGCLHGRGAVEIRHHRRCRAGYPNVVREQAAGWRGVGCDSQDGEILGMRQEKPIGINEGVEKKPAVLRVPVHLEHVDPVRECLEFCHIFAMIKIQGPQISPLQAPYFAAEVGLFWSGPVDRFDHRFEHRSPAQIDNCHYASEDI